MAYQPQHFAPGEAPPTKPGGIITIYGHTATGKTWFCVNTWDVNETLFLANFDRCARHLIKKYEGKGGTHYDQFTAMTQPQAKAVLEKLEGMRNAAISTGKAVFVIDNVHSCANIVSLALYDKSKPGALAYGIINTWWSDFLLPLEKAGIWCLLTAPSKELWSDMKSTGLYGADTWKHLDNPIMGELWLFTTRPLGAKDTPQAVGPGELAPAAGYPDLEYKGQIMLAKKRPEVQGMILKNPTLKGILKAMKEVE